MVDLTTTPSAIASAMQAFHPSHFGFRLRDGVPINHHGEFSWQKSYPHIGEVYYTQLDWQHANQFFQWNDIQLSGLRVINALQHSVWGLEESDLTSALDMSNLVETGGSMGIAYRAETGLTAEGWLGFVLGYGARNGILASRFLAVHPSVRKSGIARDMKLLQAYAALNTGHHAAEWTFDPMRSVNAYLNFNKLGAFAERYKINKYGALKTKLYGDVPSDRFVVRWNFTDSSVQAHIHGKAKPIVFNLEDVPTATPVNVQTAIDERWPLIKLPIPYDIDQLAATKPNEAQEYRATVREVCSRLLNAEIPKVDTDTVPDPAFAWVEHRSGIYRLIRTITDATHQQSFYIFQLKEQ